ncbi:MAG: NUDIX domain-containing protein [Lachnospiraceae bacterium]|nr:NUDIX domain-containing protein [Lachnospiraceae bacterium]
MADYIKELRSLIGHRPILHGAGSVIIENERGEILLGKRTDNHLWGYSGGGMEPGETVEECARRELQEEMGLTADELSLFMIHSGPESYIKYPNGDEVYYLEIIYRCSKYHGEIRRQPEELDAIRFFAPEEITLDMISPPIRPVIRKYLKEVSDAKAASDAARE